MTAVDLRAIVGEANLAPSVHNTQPTRWKQDGDGLLLTVDAARKLPASDPSGEDADISLGAAVLGTCVALARQGIGVAAVEQTRHSARIAFGTELTSLVDETTLTARVTWRGGFPASSDTHRVALQSFCAERPDAALAVSTSDMEALARINDSASLSTLRDGSIRAELLDWMRLDRRHPMWGRDGMNAEALVMSGFEAAAAGLVLGPLFRPLDMFGLAKLLVGERTKTMTSTGLVALHVPAEASAIDAGSALYDLWLGLAARGFAAWPMAVLADDPTANAETRRLLGIADTRRLITVLRVGPHPGAAQPARARLDPAELIIA